MTRRPAGTATRGVGFGFRGMTRPLAAAVAALAALVLAPATTAAAPPWSEPVTLGPPADLVTEPSIGFSSSGWGVLGWNGYDTSPAAGRLGTWPPGAPPRETPRLDGDLVAPPVVAGGWVVVAYERPRTRRFSVLEVATTALDGSARRTRRIRRHRSAQATVVAVAPGGGIVALWAEAMRRGRHRLRLAEGSLEGRFRRPRTIARLGTQSHPGLVDVAAAYTSRGELVVVHQRTTRRGVVVEARTGSPRRLRRRRLGRGAPLTDVRLAIATSGRVVAVWGAQDGGEEANHPYVVRAAVREPGRRGFGRARTLHRADAPARPAGRLALAVAPDGTATAAWSAAVGPRFPYAFPLLVATSPPGARFGPAIQLDPHAAAGDAAVSADGDTLVVWSRILRGNEQEPDQVFAALRPAGASAFGPPEEVSPAEVATRPAAAFDPLSGDAVVVWSGRPGGPPPEVEPTRTAVLRAARR